MQWLVRSFWKLCGGILGADLSYNKFQYVYTTLLLATCVYNFLTASQTLCKMDQWCVIFSSTLIGMYDRILTLTTFLSRIAVVYGGKQKVSRYRATIMAFEVYSPTTAAELKSRETFSFAIVFLYLIIVVPTNVSRLYYLYYYESRYDMSLLVYYLFMYLQNLSMCCVETQFIAQCFVVYTKFCGINADLKNLKEENIDHARYPFLTSGLKDRRADETTGDRGMFAQRAAVRYDKDFYRPRVKGHPMANTVEILRIKHWLVRQSTETLNNLFGVHMGMSVFYVWVVALFDIYYEMFHTSPSELLVYGWMLQYSLRLFVIILMAHYTTKQVRPVAALTISFKGRAGQYGKIRGIIL